MNAESISQTRRTPSWLWLGLGFAAFVLGGGVFFASSTASSRGAGAAAERETRPPLVEIARIRAAAPTYLISAPGRLEARNTLSVVGEVTGKITDVHPELVLGGRFEPGEVLFRINPGDYQAEFARAQATLETARAVFETAERDRNRQARLAETGIASEAALDRAKASLADARAAVKQAEAQFTLARSNLAKTTVSAPFPALVVSESVSEDTYVAPGAELARLIDTTAGEIEAGITPADINGLRAAIDSAGDTPLTVRAVPNEASLGSVTLTGTIDRIAPSIDPASRTVAVVAVFPGAFSNANEGRVFAGDFMTLEIEGRASQPLYDLPESAVRRDSFVWLVNTDGRLEQVAVNPVSRQENRAQVTAARDLSGARVMVTPLAEETAGMRVRVQGEG